ncbi:MAG: hypothetical protein R3E39_32220 [Anaerolineae bacterium]
MRPDMLERFSRWWQNRTTTKSVLFQDTINPSAAPELYRLACLIDEANWRISQGGDALAEQKIMDVISTYLKFVRINVKQQNLNVLAIQLQMSVDDCFYAESGILEPDLFFKILPPWAQYLGCDSSDLEIKAEALCLGKEINSRRSAK